MKTDSQMKKDIDALISGHHLYLHLDQQQLMELGISIAHIITQREQQAVDDITDVAYVYYAGSFYKVAELTDRLGVPFVGIYDEPPSEHIDYIKLENCKPKTD